MKKLLAIPLIAITTFVAFAAYIADRLLGIVAFTGGYFLFCLATAILMGTMWFICFRRHSLLIAAAVFCLLAANFLLPPPSERLLRAAMLEAAPGTDANAIETIVGEAYRGTAFALPAIKRDRSGHYDRVHVSLLSQEAGSCTAAIFLVEDGKIVRSIFSPD